MSLKQKQKKVPFAEEFPELADVLTFAGLEDDEDEYNDTQKNNELDNFPFGVGKAFLTNMDDDTLVRYTESIESGAELFTILNLNCAGYDGLERFNEMVKSVNGGIQPELVPVIMLSSYIDICEVELRNRNMLVDYRKNHPFYNFATNDFTIYESFHDRVMDLVAQFTAGYIDDVALRNVFYNLYSTYNTFVEEYKKANRISTEEE